MRLQTYQLIGLFAAAAADDCPYSPDPSTGVCGECPDVRDSQCVVNGNWYSCFQDLETCCDDWSIQGSLGTEHCLAASGGAKVNCDDVVALDASVWNYQCRDKCLAIQDDGGNPKDDASFASLCGVETLEVVNGHTTSSGSCFDNWIYGYSEPAELAGYFSHDYVISPALCQMLCQNDPTCVRFTFSIGEGTNDKTGRCVLKNADQVASPLETVFPGGKGLNSNYCNTEMENACKNLYDCLKCNDTTRCVWASDNRLSGWKHCSDQRDSCDPHPSTPQPTTTTTTTTRTTKPTTTTTTTKPTTTTTTTKPTTTTTTTKPTTTTTTTKRTATTKPTTTTTAKPITTKRNTTTKAKPTTTTTRPMTATTTPAADTTTAGGGGNGAKIATGVASAAGGLALLGGALRYFNRPPANVDAAFVANEAQMPEFQEREAAGAATEDMYA